MQKGVWLQQRVLHSSSFKHKRPCARGLSPLLPATTLEAVTLDTITRCRVHRG